MYIDAFTPATISMSRLAEYMRDFAEILGHHEHVHFEKLKNGSFSLATRVDPVAQNKVSHRIEEIRYGGGPKTALKAKQSLDDRLAEDNAIGRVVHRGAKVIEFAGRTRIVERSSGPVEQADSLVGEVIQIGGRDETINIHLKMGDEVFSHCVASKAVARRLAHHLFGPPIRLRGTGVWSRTQSGAWRLHRFNVEDFETLDSTPLPNLFRSLRAKVGTASQSRVNPILFLQQLREE
ncbi:MAG TPA: hypothetical protein VKU19_32990 [Bryobacteraceae bacterium]|nr:hypothetical protein [Bryobacteraceae bacterium]